MRNRNNNPMPMGLPAGYELQRPVEVPIIPQFRQEETEKAIKMFHEADRLSDEIRAKLINEDSYNGSDYPVPVHCVALPQLAISAWLQGVSVQRISDQQGIKQPTTEICLELARTEDPLSGIIYIPYSTVIYLAFRSHFGKDKQVVVKDSLLETYAKIEV